MIHRCESEDWGTEAIVAWIATAYWTYTGKVWIRTGEDGFDVPLSRFCLAGEPCIGPRQSVEEYMCISMRTSR